MFFVEVNFEVEVTTSLSGIGAEVLSAIFESFCSYSLVSGVDDAFCLSWWLSSEQHAILPSQYLRDSRDFLL